MHTTTTTLPLALAALAAHALAYSPSAGSAVGGNLSVRAPWSLPADKFQSATRDADAGAAFNITGYNTSSSAPSPQSAAGWRLAAHVKDDVSLSATTNKSLDASQVFEATTLYVEPPAGMATMDASWRICAVVYTGLSASALSAGGDNDSSSSTVVDGGCGSFVGSGCLQALMVAATSGSGPMDNSGECTSLDLPSPCSGAFASGVGNTSAISINQTVLDAKSFYAYGSTPTGSGNKTAQAEARQNIWPVVMVYGHLSGGQLSSTNAAVQCIRAENGTTDDDIDSGAARLGMGRSAMAVLGSVLVSSWML